MVWEKVYTERGEFEKTCRTLGKRLRGLTYREAIKEALALIMKQDKSVFIMGEGVDDPTGVFGTTLGLQKIFGKERVFDTPIAENTITGMALGAAITGMKPIVVHMRMDFLLLAMDQIVNHISKWRYMFGGKLKIPLVIRTIIGRGWGSAAQHSQSLQGLFLHIPGLKIVIPASPYDVKGLLIASIEEGTPIIFIEHRWLYEHIGYVPKGIYSVPIGKGIVRKEGKDLTVVGISYMVFESLKAAEVLREENIDIEVIDIRTLKPLDEEIIFKSVKKTGKLIIADTGWLTGGVTAEISARVTSNIFKYLKAPVIRIASPDCPTPSSPVLEKAFYPGKEEIVSAVKRIFKE
ncbi:MAG: alpha-ketoacid dehydrogenase subunit beta [Candidatus Omnitrophica bacterium]|nr:alpha-ketoacid dehydrogenase subunit beta [Candidatus Omnitrophota bacterium]